MTSGMTTEKPTIRICLLWHAANSDNFGIGALTLSHIAILERAAEKAGVTPHFVIVSWKDSRASYINRPDVTLSPIRTRDLAKPSGLLAILKGCDIVFDIGAGDSFTDIYGMKRFWTILVSKLTALVAGKPLVLVPQTIGPFERSWTRPLARFVIDRSRIVATRDRLSTAFTRDLGVKREIMEAADVALMLPFEKAPKRTDGKRHVGINVSGLLFSGGYTKDNMFGLKADYPDLVRAIIEHLSSRGDCTVHLVGHVITDTMEVEDDYRACLKLAEEYPDVIVAPKFDGPIEAKSYISGLDFFLGARMHACIAAFSSGVPVLPMAYSRKFEGLFGTLGYDAIADCKADDRETVLAKLADALEDPAGLSAKIEAGLTEGKARLTRYEDLAASLMKELV